MKDCPCGELPAHQAHYQGELVFVTEMDMEVEELDLLMEAQLKRKRNTKPN